MAEFVPINNDKYKIIGVLNEEDIKRINSFRNRTILVMDNTVGLTSELISKINSDRIVFSIKGGLDYDNKEKYNSQKYIDRTLVSPSGLKNIIKYFEYNESLIDPNWNEFEKAMFLYNSLVVDMEYAENYDTIQSKGTTERSLNGILYGKLVCAGFAQVYKEMLDRIGIKNYYQNQKDVHAFNIIEINDKKYGVDVTWDNSAKKYNNGKCSFKMFGQDPDFYARHGHKLYREEFDFDVDEFSTKRVYDSNEEVFDLSLISNNELNEYYSHIMNRINERKPFRYNLQDQSIDIKNKYLPVDVVDYKLKQEATEEYPIVVILDFLRSRNKINISSQLVDAFSSRKGYLMDMGDMDGKYMLGLDLSLVGIPNYKIDHVGTLYFNDDKRQNSINGAFINDSNINEDELNIVCDNLNTYLNKYFDNYLSNTINNLDTLLENYEYKPNEWDSDRALVNTNMNTKLEMIVNSRDYLIDKGYKEIDGVIDKINNKYNEVHKLYETNNSQKDNDLDFLSVIFGDINMAWQVFEYDRKKKITEEEFTSLFMNVDYIIQMFEKYVVIGNDNKFNINDYNVSKDDLQKLLNNIILDYKNEKMISESIINEETKNR